MSFRPIPLSCECGLRPVRLKQVGLTPQHQLVIVWWCHGCKRNISVVKDLADCWRDCPKPEDCSDNARVPTTLTDQMDSEFLRVLGVRLPDGPE